MTETKFSVLIVDDDAFIRQSLKDILTNDFNVLTAQSTKEAIKKIKTNPKLDLVVTDLVLSETDASSPGGVEIVQFLKDQEASDIPVAVFSAYFGEFSEDLAKIGVDAFFNKADFRPLHFEKKLKEIIAEAARKRIKKAEQSLRLNEFKELLTTELDRLLPLKARTLTIPGEGNFELMKPLIGYKDDIEMQLRRFPFNENVFLMMKFRKANRELSDFIIETLGRHGLRGVRADATEWNITSNVYNPIAVLYCCKYGIALFDEPEEHQAYSPNVAYELGIIHYQSKDCLILRHASLPEIPFDLTKDLHNRYEKDLQVRRVVEEWVVSISGQKKALTSMLT